jgi:hypothetical protein
MNKMKYPVGTIWTSGKMVILKTHASEPHCWLKPLLLVRENDCKGPQNSKVCLKRPIKNYQGAQKKKNTLNVLVKNPLIP